MPKPQGEKADKATGKQEAFARAYIETGNATEAYRQAYDRSIRMVPPKGSPYVYALLRSDTGAIVYVGKGTGRRMFHHARDARNGKISGLRKYQGLKRLAADGVDVVAIVIDDFSTADLALSYEGALIRAIGRECLLNFTLSKGHHLQRAREQALHGMSRFHPTRRHEPYARQLMRELSEIIQHCEEGLDSIGLGYSVE